MKKRSIWVIAGLVIIGAAAWGPIVSNVEEAKYEVVQSQGSIQIRDYAPMIVAETQVAGAREEAISQGFRAIADYIFGNNIHKENVAMTAPVTQQAAQNIPMTAPVTQQRAAEGWTVRFVMPANYSLQTLPKPTNDAVTLKEIPGKRFAVVRFSGMASENSLKKQTEALQAFMRQEKLSAQSAPTFAFFNPPWTLPFLRRNEVMMEISK